MTPSKAERAANPNKYGPHPRIKLPHGLSGLRRGLMRLEDDGQGQDWTHALGPVGVALRAWRNDLIEALGGEDVVSPQQRALIELATRTHLKIESVDRFILGMPSLVNKTKRCIFAVVRERQQLADALARYLGQLGLERRPRPALSLRERLELRAAERATQVSSVVPAAEGTTDEAS